MSEALSNDAFNRTRAAVLAYERGENQNNGRQQFPALQPPIYVAKITAEITSPSATGFYEAQEQIWDTSAAAWINNPDGNLFDSTAPGVGRIYEVSGTTGIAVNSLVQVHPFGGDEGEGRWLFSIPSAGAAVTNFWVKIIAHVSGNEYTGQVFGDGPDTTETLSGQTIKFITLPVGQLLPLNNFFRADLIGSTYWADYPRWLGPLP